MVLGAMKKITATVKKETYSQTQMMGERQQMKISKVLLISSWVFILACVAPSIGDRLTLGTVQEKIHKRMVQAEVQEALGAPNIISKNSQGLEVWTYDRVFRQETSTFWLFSRIDAEDSDRTDHFRRRNFACHASHSESTTFSQKEIETDE